MDKNTGINTHESSSDVGTQSGKSDRNDNSVIETCSKRLLYRKMNAEMLHYSARSRCGY